VDWSALFNEMGLVSKQKSGTPLDFPCKSDELLAVAIRCAEHARLRRLQKFEEGPDIAAQYLLPKKPQDSGNHAAFIGDIPCRAGSLYNTTT